MHPVQGAPSSWHWKLEPASDEVKVKRAVVADVAPCGPEVIEVAGEFVSTVNVLAAV